MFNMCLCAVNSVKNDLQNVYKTIAREKYNKVGYPVHMCCICLTVLRKCKKFMETARDTNIVLKQWRKQQNKMRVARPLFTYSTSKVGVVSTYNGNISLQQEIKMEEVDLGVDEVYLDDLECNTDVKLEKTDLDEQTDSSELLLDSLNDNTYTVTVEYNSDRKIDQLCRSKIGFEETSSLGSNLDGHANVETTSKYEIISPHDNDAPPIKKCNTNDTKPQHLAPETSGETAANEITSLNSTPSQPDNIRRRNSKTNPIFGKNNCNSGETSKLGKIVKTDVIRYKSLPRNTITNSKNSNILSLLSVVEKDEINTCNYKTTVQQHITRQITSHTDKKPFKCYICGYHSNKRCNLATHMRTHTNEKPFTCNTCNNKFTQKSSLVKHMRTHTNEKPFTCNTCNYKFTQKSSLVIHMITHTGKKPFTCKTCNYKFTQKSSLVTHMRTHTGEKPFTCKTCSYKCLVKANMVRHMRTHTGEKPFSCDICVYKSTRKSHLVTHMKTHTDEKRFTCNTCNYKFTQKSSLVTHMRTHTGEKPFTCKTCSYKCLVKANMVRHMRTHTGEKPFSCDICVYKSTRKSHLVTHMKTHTDEKRFTCNTCNYKCNEKFDLAKHMRTHTGEKPFACDICDYRCSLSHHLKAHLLAKHVNKTNKKRK